MLNEERRNAILEILNREGRVLVRDLSERLQTSGVTIRKDLEILGTQGLVFRTHGGALPARAATSAFTGLSLREKEEQHKEEKKRIAIAAAALVREGQTIILDGGTTTTLLARELRERPGLTVITNAVNIASDLAGTPVNVVLTGGILHENSFLLVGPQAEDSLRRLSADILFLGVDGFDLPYGLTTPNLLEARLNHIMLEISRRTIAVCDSSKFGRKALSLIARPDEIHEVLTDSGISQTDVQALEKLGVKVTIV